MMHEATLPDDLYKVVFGHAFVQPVSLGRNIA